jgi:hypothetical protein
MHCTVKPGMYSIEWSFLPVAQRLRGGASAEPPQVAQTKFWSAILPLKATGVKRKRPQAIVVRLPLRKSRKSLNQPANAALIFFLPLLVHLRIASFSWMCLVSRPVSSLTKFPERKSL